MTVQPSERYTTRAKNASAADKNRATSFSNKKAVLPLTILTDKLRVAQGLGRNEALCTTDKGQNADGWTTIHEAPRKIEEGLRKHLVLSHGSALHPCVARVEQSYIARDSFLGWLAKILGRIHAEVKFRGWSDVVSRVQRQRRALLGKLVVFQREPRRKRAARRKVFRARTKTGKFWLCWRCGFHTARRVKGLAGRCRGVVQGRGGVLQKFKDGRNPKDGRWLAEPTWHAVGRADVVQVAATEAGWDWCGC